MPRLCVLGLAILLLGFQPQQFPPPTVNVSPHPAVDRQLPIDRPEVVTPKNKLRHMDSEQLLRDANELANLADEVPPSVLQATKGTLPKSLNERLKRIEKLSKQLRRELAP